MKITPVRLRSIATLVLFVACLTAGCSNDDSAELTNLSPANTTSPPKSGLAVEAKPAEELIQDRSSDRDKQPASSNPTDDSSLNNDRPDKELPIVNDTSFHKDLLDAASEYLQYGLINTTALAAPESCAAPPAEPNLSNSEDESTHGQKLYFLFAKEIGHYINPEESPSPVGQVVVKESWTSKRSNPDARNTRNHASGNRINPRTAVGDEVLEIGRRKNLFLMMKLPTDTVNSDNGWVYGVVNPETNEVTAAGQVSSCMNCHLEAENDRLFGPVFE